MTGFTSVTFRSFSVTEIIEIAKKAKLEGIEWGGDVHLPPGDVERARIVREQTLAAGLKIFSYGSYYKLSQSDGWWQGITPMLESAAALGAPLVRIWAGGQGSQEIAQEQRKTLTKNLRDCCKAAEKYKIEIALEYHRNTLTDTGKSTLRLLQEADCENLSTFWQPNPDISLQEQLLEIRLLGAYISNVHVFSWLKGDVRTSLKEGAECWRQYVSLLGKDKHRYILEFVKDDSAEQFVKDAKVLNAIIS